MKLTSREDLARLHDSKSRTRELVLSRFDVTGDDIKLIENMPSVRSLTILEARVRDDCWPAIPRLGQITEFRIAACERFGGGLDDVFVNQYGSVVEHIFTMRWLKRLFIEDVDAHPSVWNKVGDMEDLELLCIKYGIILPDIFSAVSKLKRLESLSLHYVLHVSYNDLSYLDLPRLKFLSLCPGELQPSCVIALSKMPSKMPNLKVIELGAPDKFSENHSIFLERKMPKQGVYYYSVDVEDSK